MRCVGYRQAWAVIDHWHAMGWTDERLLTTLKAAVGVDLLPPAAKDFFMQHPEADLRQGLGQWRSTTLAATRQLAKRQITWLRSMPARVVVAAEHPQATQQVVNACLAALA